MLNRILSGKTMLMVLLFLSLLVTTSMAFAKAGCHGRVVDPVKDICWKCLFPIKICGIKIKGSSMPDTPNLNKHKAVCMCPRPGISTPVPGLPISFWEPVRLADVTRVPYCMINLGGISLGDNNNRGVRDTDADIAYWHIHWYVYPAIYWLELLLDFACLEMLSVDVAYLTEWDPLWQDDAKATITNPESLLFANPIAQTVCVADCLAASCGLSLDPLFWCSGCQGGIYPFSGTLSYYNGGVSSSLLALTKFMAKLHRQLMLWGYMGEAGLCGRYPMPIIRKSQYRLQMLYPVVETTSCKRLGETDFFWGSGREIPVKGEDFGYLIWRKRDCCLF